METLALAWSWAFYMGIWALYIPKLPIWPLIGLPDLAGDPASASASTSTWISCDLEIAIPWYAGDKARCLIFVELGLGTKMKHIQAILEFSFVLHFNTHYTPKYKHAILHPHANRPAGPHSNPTRHWANIIWVSQADAHVTLLLRTLNFNL